MARIAITGSSGMIGRALRASLESDGHEVVAVRRGRPEDPAALWDPGHGWFRPGALESVDAVVNLAGESIGEGRWSETRKQAILSSRVDATRTLIDHIGTLSRKPAVLVNASAVGYYGSRGDETLTEESARGAGFLSDVVERWEGEAIRARELGLRVVLTRFGVVLSGSGGALQRLLLPFKLGAGGRLGSGGQWMSWIALPDVVKAIRYAIDSGIEGPVNVTAPPVRNAEFTKALGSVLRRPTLIPTPTFGLKLILGGQAADELLLTSQRVVPAKLEARGYELEHPEIVPALEAVLGK